jgi:4-phosphopantoate--beta-alanine ligase
MADEIPESHPRYRSLLARRLLTEAAAEGLLAESALIAHGRGEAFDYLLGERTTTSAHQAIGEAAARLLAAGSPVLSVNGNTVALAADQMLGCAAVLGCPIEVNIYYRTPERMSALLVRLAERKLAVMRADPPDGWAEGGEAWKAAVLAVPLLGDAADGHIPGLEGPRAACSRDGIMQADVVFVPLEDGDRCEALIAAGKQVLVVDLNPLSRTARAATVTIVDELTRVLEELLPLLLAGTGSPDADWNNDAILQDALDEIRSGTA